jgi:hypothetical protein
MQAFLPVCFFKEYLATYRALSKVTAPTDDVNGFRHAAAAATEEKSYSRFLGKNN